MARYKKNETDKYRVFVALRNATKSNPDGYKLRSLGDQLGMSHEHVRKSLIALQAEGYVKRPPLHKRRAPQIIRWPKEALSLAI